MILDYRWVILILTSVGQWTPRRCVCMCMCVGRGMCVCWGLVCVCVKVSVCDSLTCLDVVCMNLLYVSIATIVVGVPEHGSNGHYKTFNQSDC